MTNIYYTIHRPDILQYKNCDTIAESVLLSRLSKFFPNITPLDDKKEKVDSSYILICFDLASPFFDEEALKTTIDYINNLDVDNKVIQTGLVGGTSARYICKLSDESKIEDINNFKTSSLNFDTQSIYSTQLNLYKLKRQKIFKYLVNKFPNLKEISLVDFLEWCATDEGVKEILSYGEEVKLVEHTECPYCKSKNHKYFTQTSLHPVIGFLTADSKYYPQCTDCGLIYLRYTFANDELYKVYDEYETEINVRETTITDVTPENTSHYENYIAAFEYVKEKKLPIKSVLDIGCGRCQFVTLARENYTDAKIKGIDFDIPPEFVNELTKKDIELEHVNFISNLSQEQNKYDLITMWEVIEHIPIDQLQDTIADVLNLLTENGVFIFSTPDFDDEYCRLFDFWASMPIHHVSVFSKTWLRDFFNNSGATILDEMHESVAFKNGNGWASYASEFAKTEADKASYKVIQQLIDNKEALDIFNTQRRNDLKGSEIIMVVQKKELENE